MFGVMLRSFALLLLFLAFVAPGHAQTSPPRIEKPLQETATGPALRAPRDFVRFATWNIEWFPAGQRQLAKENVRMQMEAVSDIVKKIGPDILVAQEIRNLGALVALNNKAGRPFANIAATYYKGDNAKAVELKPKEIQQEVGILSYYPWKEAAEIDFSAMTDPLRPTRGWLRAAFEIKGLNFTVYIAHLKSNYGENSPEEHQRNVAKRLAAIAQLEADWKRQGLDPAKDRILIAGDFNTDFFGEAFKDEQTFPRLAALGFRNCFEGMKPEERITMPAKEGEPFGPGTFDYVWFSSAWGPDIPKAKILMEGAAKKKDVYAGDAPGLASDHYPVYVDLPLPGKEPALPSGPAPAPASEVKPAESTLPAEVPSTENAAPAP
jgi:endonuclease/exonuclease/phosphatase family metal-dependent hydrolase